jgi:hypothetical protein
LKPTAKDSVSIVACRRPFAPGFGLPTSDFGLPTFLFLIPYSFSNWLKPTAKDSFSIVARRVFLLLAFFFFLFLASRFWPPALP